MGFNLTKILIKIRDQTYCHLNHTGNKKNNPLTARSFNWNFPPLDVESR